MTFKTPVLVICLFAFFSAPLFAEMDLSDDAVMHELTEMAEHGNPEAQLMLGDWHFNGEHVERDIEKAASYYLSAAEQGLRRAQGIVGGLYYLGKGVVKDQNTARYWLEQAAGQDLKEAELLLASMDRKQNKANWRSSITASTKKPVTTSLNAMAR